MTKSSRLITLSQFLNHVAYNYRGLHMQQMSMDMLLPTEKIRQPQNNPTLADIEVWESLPEETKASIRRLVKEGFVL